MRIILTIVYFTVFIEINCAQDYLKIFDSFNQNYNYNWRGIDNRQALDFKDKFIEYAKQNDLLKNEFDIYEANVGYGSVWNNLHVVDINGDKLEDIIYSGSSGGEANVVKFFMQKEVGFELIFTAYQGIVRVDWKNGKITTIMSHDWGCCAEFRIINTVYEVSYRDKVPSFAKIYQSIEYELMKKPIEYFEEPIDFSTDYDAYNLRAFPEVNDTIPINADFNENRMGNTIGILSKGTKGKAYGSSIDETGCIWWYVEINNIFEVKDNVLFMDDLKYPTNVIGWIRSRYVTDIE
jgi:hypothetical protein